MLQKKLSLQLKKIKGLKQIKITDVKSWLNLISTKAAIFTLLVCCIPALIIGGHFINQTVQSLVEASIHNNNKVADRVANDISSYIINKKNFMMVSVSNDSIKSMDKMKAENYLEAVKVYYGNDNSLSIFNKNGQKVYSTHNNSEDNINFANVEEVWQNNRIFNKTLQKDKLGHLQINGSMPIYSDGKNVAGVLSLDIPLQNINVLIEQVLAQNPSYGIMVINKNSVPIFSQNNTEEIKNQEPLKLDFIDKAIKEQNGAAECLIRGEDYLVSYRPIDNTDFIVITTYPKAYVTKAANEMIFQGLVVLFGIIFIAMMIGMVLSKKTLAPFDDIVKGVQAVSKGDLSYRLSVNTKDEFGILSRGFNKMNNNLQELVSSVQESSKVINTTTSIALDETQKAGDSSKKVVEFAGNMMVKIEDQGDKTNIAKQSLDELNGITKKVVIGMATTLQATQQCVEISNNGKSIISKTIDAMLEIKNQVRETVNTVENLDNSVKEINKISDTISTFANQTNLLALNATIEAVRAGEHGRGFAVVAEEIRNLAEQSKMATSQIALISGNVMNATKQVIKQMQNSGDKVEQGAEIVKDTDKAFNEINEAVTTAQEQADMIFNQSEEQIQLFDTVRKQVDTINDLAQDNIVNANKIADVSNEQEKSIVEINKSTEHLLSLAKQFDQLLCGFKLN